MENSYLIRMSLFPNLNSDRHSDSVILFRLNNLHTESGCFSPRKVRQHKNCLSSMKLDARLKNKILHCFKRRHCEKLCCERTSQFYICVYIQCRRRRPTDRLHLKFPFSRRNRRSRSSLFPVNRRCRRELRRGS